MKKLSQMKSQLLLTILHHFMLFKLIPQYDLLIITDSTSVNGKTTGGQEFTPLHLAVRSDNDNDCLVTVLLNHEEDSPLHLAASSHHTTIVSKLSECESFRQKYRENPKFLGLKVRNGVITKKMYSLISLNIHPFDRIKMATHFCIWQLTLQKMT